MIDCDSGECSDAPQISYNETTILFLHTAIWKTTDDDILFFIYDRSHRLKKYLNNEGSVVE